MEPIANHKAEKQNTSFIPLGKYKKLEICFRNSTRVLKIFFYSFQNFLKSCSPQGKSRVTNMNYSLWVKNLLNSPVTSKLTCCKVQDILGQKEWEQGTTGWEILECLRTTIKATISILLFCFLFVLSYWMIYGWNRIMSKWLVPPKTWSADDFRVFKIPSIIRM